MRATILGATGGTGAAITAELAERGHQVIAASRSVTSTDPPAGVEARRVDLTDRDETVEVCRGADVVVMAATVGYRRWETDLGLLFDHALHAAADAGARLVVVDNLYAYGSPGTPIDESTPEAATTRKGDLRRALAQRLLDAHAAGRASVTIGRFADYYGPRGTSALVFALGIKRALDGKAPQAFVDADQPHTFHYLPDVGRAFATLAERPDAHGRPWILPAAPPVTQRELLTMIATATGRPPRIGRVSPALLRLVGLFSPDLSEMRELVEQFDRPYTTDASAFTDTFGPITLTPHEQAIAETIAWFRAAPS